MRKYPDAPPRLDPVEDMGIEDPTLFEATAKIEKLEAQLATNPGKNTCALVCVCVLYVSVCVCVSCMCQCVCVCVCVQKQMLSYSGLTLHAWLASRQCLRCKYQRENQKEPAGTFIGVEGFAFWCRPW